MLLKQKDKMLDTCQKQLESLRRKTEKLEEQLELWQRLSEPSRQTFPPKEDKEELPQDKFVTSVLLIRTYSLVGFLPQEKEKKRNRHHSGILKAVFLEPGADGVYPGMHGGTHEWKT